MHSLLANGLFWASVVCCTVAQVLIIRSVRGARHLAKPVVGIPRARDTMEMIWAVLPAVVLAGLLFFTWQAIHGTQMQRAPRAASSVAVV